MIKIGLTLSVENRGAMEEGVIPSDYINAVLRCGALPVLIPAIENLTIADHYIDMIDGLILTGGDDVSPELYGEINSGLSRNVSRKRDEMELYIIGRAIESGCPILGICRGFQLINVYFGGSLYQDISAQVNGVINHANLFRESTDLHHEVSFKDNSTLSRIIGSPGMMINSRHHQGIKVPGEGLTVSASSSDGIIEAFECIGKNIIAVQWHPENLITIGEKYKALFDDLISRSVIYAGKKESIRLK